MNKMKLRDELNKYKNNIVKVGSFSGFIYCGIGSNAFKELEKATTYYKNYYEKSLFKSYEHLDNFEAIWDKKIASEIKKSISREKKQKKTRSVKVTDSERIGTDDAIYLYNHLINEYRSFCRKKEKDLVNTKKRIKTYKKILKNWSAFLDRDVKKVYSSIWDADVIIIIDGSEQGEFFDVSEYRGY